MTQFFTSHICYNRKRNSQIAKELRTAVLGKYNLRDYSF